MADKRRKREAERRARLEEERKRRARRTRRNVAVGALVVVVVVVLIVSLTGSSGERKVEYVSGPTVDPNTLLGIQKTPPPWPDNTDELRARLNAETMPPLSAMEGQVLHIHQHLDIYIRGRSVQVPASIGIIRSPSTLYAPLHTHDTTGIIHVESPTRRDFSLGEFFDVWGVFFTPTCIGSYCNMGNERLQVFANGRVVTGDPRKVKLTQHEEIVVTFGTPAQIPQPYPITYRFPSNY